MLTTSLPSDLDLELVAEPRLLRSAVRRAQLVRLAMKGVDAKQAASLVACAPETARAIYSDPAFRRDVLSRVEQAFGAVDESFAARRLTLHEKLEMQAQLSFDQLVEMLEKPTLSDGLRMHINQDFLDRVVEGQRGEKRTLIFEPQQLAVAARTAREMDVVMEGPLVRTKVTQPALRRQDD